MYGGHIGIHFEKHFTKMFVKSSRYCREKKCVKAWEFNFLSAAFFFLSAILAAILKEKFTKMFVESGRYCRKKIVSKSKNLIFYQ